MAIDANGLGNFRGRSLPSPVGLPKEAPMNWWIVGLLSNLTIAAGFLALGWTLRGRIRQHQALSIHDDVLQGIVTAKLSFELGDPEQGMVQLDQTLESARHLVSDLLDGPRLTPGHLRRTTTRAH
jgi:hypothetical protein